ncbi:hypothetical protein [Desulfovibrio inopinatus]|uniref:hypothetical protein n=1 Tax=Desulfovibrio inopinatus TaxID=102109 RepID=UPI0012EC1509|nr:hypothetical protein [Desulfovibrio inopinatus]
MALQEFEQEFVAAWEGHLPPYFGRQAIETLFPGMISSKTVANLESKGEGPDGAYRLGGKVVYKRENFVRWLVDRGFHPRSTQDLLVASGQRRNAHGRG